MSLGEELILRLGGNCASKQLMEASVILGQTLEIFQKAAAETGRAKYAPQSECDAFMVPYRDKVLSAVEVLIRAAKENHG